MNDDSIRGEKMNLYNFNVKNDVDEVVSLAMYQDKVVIIVNTATKCGLTPQYTALQELYAKYNDQGLVVLDFPCNQFHNQAPGSIEEINEFCQLNYGTKFPRFAKIEVNGKAAEPLFVWLKQQQPNDISDQECKSFETKVGLLTLGNKKDDIKWNFGKFLINRSGEVVGRYSPAWTPDKMEQDIIKLLDR